MRLNRGKFGLVTSQMMSYYMTHIRNLLQTCVSDLDLEIGMVYLIHEVVLLPSSRFCHQANFSEIAGHLRVFSRSSKVKAGLSHRLGKPLALGRTGTL